MRTLYFSLLLIALLAVGRVVGQNSSSDCIVATPICGDSVNGITFGNDGGGGVNDFDGLISVGCLEKGSVASGNIEGNASWFVFRVAQSGRLGFNIQRQTATSEFDFALFGPDPDPSSSNFCADLGAGAVTPIRCNYEQNATDFTGIGINPTTGQVGAPNVVGSNNTYDEFLEVQEGEVYYLFVNNFNTNPNPDPEPFSIEFTEDPNVPASAPEIDCDFGFEVVATPGPPYCEGQTGIQLDLVLPPYLIPYVTNISWARDADNDGTPESVVATGATVTSITVDYPDGGRYRVSIDTNLPPDNPVYSEGLEALIEFNGVPEPNLITPTVTDDLTTAAEEVYNIRVAVAAPGSFEYALIPVDECLQNAGACGACEPDPNFELDWQADRNFQDIPAGLYYLRVRDTTGCEEITDCDSPIFLAGFPRFFSPNADGINDFWNLRGLDPTLNWNYVLFIFDRYGQFIKQLEEQSQGQDNLGWDGTLRNVAMPSSDYWFRLIYELPDGSQVEPVTVRSHFSLIRGNRIN